MSNLDQPETAIRRELVQLLEQLAVDHELYQQTELAGNHDASWSKWYADRLLREGPFLRLGLQFTANELAASLEAGFASFSADPATPWAEHVVSQWFS